MTENPSSNIRNRITKIHYNKAIKFYEQLELYYYPLRMKNIIICDRDQLRYGKRGFRGTKPFPYKWFSFIVYSGEKTVMNVHLSMEKYIITTLEWVFRVLFFVFSLLLSNFVEFFLLPSISECSTFFWARKKEQLILVIYQSLFKHRSTRFVWYLSEEQRYLLQPEKSSKISWICCVCVFKSWFLLKYF